MLTILALYHIVALRRPCMLCLQLTVFIQMRPLQPLRLIGVTPVDLGIINHFYSRLLESEYLLVLNPIFLLHQFSPDSSLAVLHLLTPLNPFV